jgi:hypothetical protein
MKQKLPGLEKLEALRGETGTVTQKTKPRGKKAA